MLAAIVLPAALTPSTPRTTVVLAAADIPAGTLLEEEHLREVEADAALTPHGATRAAELHGRRTSRHIPAGSVVQKWAVDPPTQSAPSGSATVALPLPAALASRVSAGSQLLLARPDPRDGSLITVRALVIEAPATPPASLTPGHSPDTHPPAVALVAVAEHDAGEITHAIDSNLVSVSVLN